MASREPLIQLPVSVVNHVVSAVALDADFDTRWAAWVERGRVHEQRVRRTLVTWVSVLAVGSAIIYAFFRS
jgi:hypothetical protein